MKNELIKNYIKALWEFPTLNQFGGLSEGAGGNNRCMGNIESVRQASIKVDINEIVESWTPDSKFAGNLESAACNRVANLVILDYLRHIGEFEQREEFVEMLTTGGGIGSVCVPLSEGYSIIVYCHWYHYSGSKEITGKNMLMVTMLLI